MPELPEVETVRRTLAPVLGQRVEAMWTSGLPLRLNRPVPEELLREISLGRTVEDIRRWGKYLLLDLAGACHSVLVHLGMSGRLRMMAAAGERPPHTHVAWLLSGGAPPAELRYSDPRRFGVIDVVERGNERAHPSLARLGEDPLTGALTGALLHAGSRRVRRSIKTFLLDQHTVAGVGNIYASEALWQARILPTMPAERLSKARADALAAAIHEVFARALEHGGTSLRDFVNADGHAGEHAHYLWVYERDGEPCPRPTCPGIIRRTVLQARSTFHCPRCQRR